MSKLLVVQGSPREGRSYARAVTGAFASAYQESNPADEVEVIDLFKANLPAFDGPALQGKYSILHGKEHSSEEAEAWKAVVRVIEQFKSADKFVFAVPMWNFGIPYRVKQYLDVIIQPGLTFSFDPESGYSGLVTGRPAFVAYSSGGDYSPGSGMESMDFQKPYFEQALGFIGFTDVRTVSVNGTLAEGAEDRKAAAIEEAVEAARDF